MGKTARWDYSALSDGYRVAGWPAKMFMREILGVSVTPWQLEILGTFDMTEKEKVLLQREAYGAGMTRGWSAAKAGNPFLFNVTEPEEKYPLPRVPRIKFVLDTSGCWGTFVAARENVVVCFVATRDIAKPPLDDMFVPATDSWIRYLSERPAVLRAMADVLEHPLTDAE